MRAFLFSLVSCVALLGCESATKRASLTEGLDGAVLRGTLTDGPVLLRANTGRFVSANAAGTAVADRTAIGAWERFMLQTHESGKVSFLSHHKTYLTGEDDLSAQAKRRNLDGRALFTVEPQPDGRFAFRTARGFYLTANAAGSLDVNASQIFADTSFLVARSTSPEMIAAAGRISIVGTQEAYTPEALRKELADQGLTLVEGNKIAEGECGVVYPSANGEKLDAEFGVLACEVRVGDNVTLQTRAIYGECDASLTRGAGAECEIGVGSQDIVAAFPGGESTFNVKGPNVAACGSVTADKLCANAGATLAESSVEVVDENGNGVGMGVSVGVGAGVDGGFDDGVLSGSLDLRSGIGASISFSVNVEDIGDKAMWVGETGFTLASGHVVAASRDGGRFYDKELAPGVVDASGKVIVVVEKTGGDVIRVVDGTSREVVRNTGKFLTGAGKGIEDTGKTIGDTLGEAWKAVFG